MPYDYYLSRKNGNTKLIISSHGGYLSTTFRTPIDLHFMTHQNYCAKGQVTKVLAMSNKEFETEKTGTSGVSDYALTYYQHDVPASIQEAVNAGMDVITIKSGKTVNLSTIVVTDMPSWAYNYTEVYCMFCRVAMQATYVKVM